MLVLRKLPTVQWHGTFANSFLYGVCWICDFKSPYYCYQPEIVAGTNGFTIAKRLLRQFCFTVVNINLGNLVIFVANQRLG